MIGVALFISEIEQRHVALYESCVAVERRKSNEEEGTMKFVSGKSKNKAVQSNESDGKSLLKFCW